MTKEVEDIIRYKSWEELTKEERELIADFANSAEDYGQMRWFLTETKTVFQKRKIIASPDLKKGVMAALDEEGKKPVIWLNSVGAFLLPEGKRIYEKPGFQLAVAAVLVVGFLWMFQMDCKQPEIAQNIENDLNTPIVTNEHLEEEKSSSNDQEEKDLLNEQRNSDLISQPAAPQEGEIVGDMVDEKPVAHYDETMSGSGLAEMADEVMAVPEIEEQEILFTEDLANDDKLADALEDEKKDRKRREMESPSYADVDMVDAEEMKEADNAAGVTRSSPNNLGRNLFSKKEKASAVVAEPLAVTEEAEATEEILPKTLHINQTKELKSLFFTVK